MMDDAVNAGAGERVRLKALEPVGTAGGMPAWGAALFGLPFFALGVGGVLAGLGWLKVAAVDSAEGRWVALAGGATFAAAGLWVWAGAWWRGQRERARREAQAAHPEEPALADYAWDPAGAVDRPWVRVARNLAILSVVAVFLSMFNVVVFGRALERFPGREMGAEVPTFVRVVEMGLSAGQGLAMLAVGLFDLAVLAGLGMAGLAVVRALRFGGGAVRWERFPLATGGPVTLRFELPRTILEFAQAEVDLRCVEEFYVETQRGSEESRTLVHEQIWTERRTVEGREYDPRTAELAVTFHPPAGLPPTALAAARPIFWRAELRVRMRGPDYVAAFLVPVYGPRGGEFPVANGAGRV